MAFLLIDNSNTRTKFALADREQLLDFRAIIPTCDLSVESIQAALAEIHFDQIVISSVVPDKAKTLSAAFSDQKIHFISHQTDLGIDIDYPNPEQLGADRLANSVGVAHLYRSPSIVIDFGTAVTFDVVTEDKTYIGGVIAPGLGSMTKDLQERTALLPQVDFAEPSSAIGKSTQHAMQAGSFFGYRGLVRGVLDQLTAELPGEVTVVATGGDSEVIVHTMTEISHYHHELTLEGLRVIACRMPR